MRNFMLEVFPVTSFYQFVFPEAPVIIRKHIASFGSLEPQLNGAAEMAELKLWHDEHVTPCSMRTGGCKGCPDIHCRCASYGAGWPVQDAGWHTANHSQSTKGEQLLQAV